MKSKVRITLSVDVETVLIARDYLMKKANEDPETAKLLVPVVDILESIRDAQENEKQESELKNYRFWCSEGCGFVTRNHRCEQWSALTYVSPELYAALRKK
jgi:hypothetical protein